MKNTIIGYKPAIFRFMESGVLVDASLEVLRVGSTVAGRGVMTCKGVLGLADF